MPPKGKDSVPIMPGPPQDVGYSEHKTRQPGKYGSSKAGLGSQKLEMVEASRDQVNVGKQKPNVP